MISQIDSTTQTRRAAFEAELRAAQVRRAQVAASIARRLAEKAQA